MTGFLWINSKSIPFKGYFFLDPQEEIILVTPDPSEIPYFFDKIQNLVKKGFYALGFFSYELGYLLEKRLFPLYRKPEVPLAHFIFFKKKKPLEILPLKDQFSFKVFSETLNISKEEYIQALSKIKDYIASGDTYQVNFTVKFKFLFEGNPFELFQALLFSQRCEYACYFPAGDYLILSFSPELFLRKRGKELLSSPMKGTEKRAPLLSLDKKTKNLLKKDVKTQAENIMIVDLIRNDLGRVCLTGSVWVSELFKIKTYPTLHQMISTIKGTLKKNKLFEIFKALFPCGSITGAPKIRTMEIIRELEREPRNVYTGAMGFITPEGDFLFNVAIRTVLLKPLSKNLYQGELGVGAGIVWDSDPEREFEETKLKANFFFSPLPYFELFETFLWDSESPRLKFHYKRLLNSSRFFRFVIPEDLKSYENFLNFLRERLGVMGPSLRVKLILSPEGELKIESKPFESPSWGDKDLKVGLVKRDTPKNLFHFHKTTHREEYDFYRKKAEELGLTEILFYNDENYLLEGTISNIFLKRGKFFLTTPLEFGLLPGILREELLKKGLAREYPLKIEDLKKGELYIGNSLRGLGKVKDWVIL
ncbi:MAG: aminodeoxychorismate synthase component I [Caldimicrobium sp.]